MTIEKKISFLFSLSQPHSLLPSPVTILYSEPFDAYLVQLPTVSYRLEMKET